MPATTVTSTPESLESNPPATSPVQDRPETRANLQRAQAAGKKNEQLLSQVGDLTSFKADLSPQDSWSLDSLSGKELVAGIIQDWKEIQSTPQGQALSAQALDIPSHNIEINIADKFISLDGEKFSGIQENGSSYSRDEHYNLERLARRMAEIKTQQQQIGGILPQLEALRMSASPYELVGRRQVISYKKEGKP